MTAAYQWNPFEYLNPEKESQHEQTASVPLQTHRRDDGAVESGAPQRAIGRIKLSEPKCSWQQSGRKSLGSGCEKGKGEWRCMWPRFDVIKKNKKLGGPEAIYKTERHI